MKIGVITYWESKDNYGQILQVWALQQVLLKMGHEPFLIKYLFEENPYRRKKKPVLKNIIKCLLIYPKIKELRYTHKLSYLNKRNKERKFEKFRNEYILESNKVYSSIEELRTFPPKADAYITGSDQVWSQLLNNEENKTFFLDFGDQKIRRISYAPSFSINNYPLELKDELKKQLSHFNNISVREKQGQEICNNIGFSAEHVLDPTLLLSNSEYDKLIKSEIFNDDIYVYSLNIKSPEELRWNEIQKYALDEKLTVTVTTSSGHYKGFEILPDASYIYPTINEWLLRIKNAKLVITTSFHGTVFAIQMHTPFIFIPLLGKKSAGNSRVLELLGELELQHRILYNSMELKDIIETNINWENVDNKLISLKQHSIDFLKSSL